MNLHPLAAIAMIGAAALAGCGQMGDLERPGPMVGKGSGADAGADPTRQVRTIDPRTRDDRPAPPRTLPIDSAQNPTASAPQGALPDPYANPR
jgi:predicted small lipoprotein YifL